MQPKTIGDRIQILMFEKKISRFELAEMVGVEQTTVWRWWANKSEPKSSEISKLAKIFGVTCDYLIDGN